MRNKARLFLTIACVVILFDVAASFASRSLRFNYGNLIWAFWCLYLASGYFGCKYHDFRTGVMAGLIAGLSDSTIGWALSHAIGPYLPSRHPPLTLLLISVVVIIVTATGTFFGLIGALFGKIIKRQ